MRQFVYALAFAASTVVAFPAIAQGRSEPVFSCTLDSGKSVRVTEQAGRFTYRYGSARYAELMFTVGARSGNVHQWLQRFAGIETQLRFTNGTFHYIVYSMEGNPQTGAQSISGLVVMRGTRRIADHSCRRYTEVGAGYQDLPADDETYSAM